MAVSFERCLTSLSFLTTENPRAAEVPTSSDFFRMTLQSQIKPISEFTSVSIEVNEVFLPVETMSHKVKRGFLFSASSLVVFLFYFFSLFFFVCLFVPVNNGHFLFFH